MHTESWVRQGEYFHRLRLFDNIVIPDKSDEYIIKYNTESSDNIIELNPYISLVNGTDLLIVKEIPGLFTLTYAMHLNNLKLTSIDTEIVLEVSNDGINYKEKILSPLNPLTKTMRVSTGYLQSQKYKEFLLLLVTMDFSYINEFAVGTYLRCKVRNISKKPLMIMPFNSVSSKEEKYSIELSLHIMKDN